MFLAGIGMFGVFLFLTYYMQGGSRLQRGQVRGWPSCRMTGMIIVVASLGSAVLVTKISSRILIPTGHGAVGDRAVPADPHQPGAATTPRSCCPRRSSWARGSGLVFAPGLQPGRAGCAKPSDAGVASAAVNVMPSRSAARSAPRCSTPSPARSWAPTWPRTCTARSPAVRPTT